MENLSQHHIGHNTRSDKSILIPFRRRVPAVPIVGKLLLAFTLAANLGLLASAADSLKPVTYQIRNVKYLDLLRPREANSADGTPIVLYPAQPWKCMTWRLQPTGESTFQLKNLFTSKTFTAQGETNAAGRSVAQVPLPKDAGASCSWQFVKLADGHYKIAEPISGRVLTAVKNLGASEASIVVAPWQDRSEQKWVLEEIAPKDLTM